MTSYIYGLPVLCLAVLAFSTVSFSGSAQPLIKNDNKPLNVIFDLNGVLLGTNATTAFRQLGLFDVATYCMTTMQNPRHMKSRVKSKLYQVLNTIQPTGNNWGVDDPDGDQLPGLMCDWMDGTKNTHEIRELVLPAIKQNRHWFANRFEQKIIFNLARMMFTPTMHARNVKIIKKGLQFVRECKRKGYGVYVLSNWDAESIQILKRQYPELFDLFDEIIISAEVGLAKPQPTIYQLFTRSLGSQNCVFIDDQIHNVKAAADQGMHAIHCHPHGAMFKTPHWKHVRKEFARIECAMIPDRVIPAQIDLSSI